MEMYYRRRRFAAALGAALAALAAIGVAIYLGGVAVAVPIAGIGDFHVNADQVRLQGFVLTPRIGDNSSNNVSPETRVQAQHAEVDGLVLYKDIPTPYRTLRVEITASGTVKINGLIQDITQQTASSASFNQLEIDEAPPSKRSSWQQSFYQIAPSVTLNNFRSNNDYQFANTITLPGLKVSARFL